MQISTIDISKITTAVRRHEALLRYARYMLIFNLAIFLWVAVPQQAQVRSPAGLFELATSPAWRWAAFVLATVAATRI